jgi:RimJ/RimL family protein N-acetyltransferase
LASTSSFSTPSKIQPRLATPSKNPSERIPLQETDFSALYIVASDPLVWEQHPNKLRYQKDVFQNYFEGAMLSKGAFLIRDCKTNEIVGCSRFYDYNENENSILIGYTFIGRNFWGKGYNKALKKLMLDYAFQFVNTVILYIGENNIRSQKAIQKIGAIYFGKLNKSLVYTINKQDWILKYKG